MKLLRRTKPAPVEQPIMTARGANGELHLFEHKVRILRGRNQKDIHLATISSVQFKRMGRLTGGFLQLSFAGGQEAKGGLFEAASDENTVSFNKKGQQKEFERLADELDRRIAARARA